MKTICTFKTLCFIACVLFYCNAAQSQCSLSLTVSTTESRCKSTGSITAVVTGGSGSYNYRITGAVPPIVTSTNNITGLPPGTYRIEVKDVADGCTVVQDNVAVPGNYQDPRFQLTATDVSCIGGHDGTITVAGQQYGTPPFVYSIVAPSASGIGITNATGVFTNLPAGSYSVRLTDSCGGLQTRIITIADYNWWIDAATVTKTSCTYADAAITLRDNKGNVNTSGTAFTDFIYGVSKAPGDTAWYASRTFNFFKSNAHGVTLIAKDGCGNIKTMGWTNPDKPAIAATISISNRGCNNFTASVTGQVNLTSAQYCLYTNSSILVSCNATGVFNNVPYGSYQMRVRDDCYDTTIIRNFTVTRLAPSVAGAATASNLGCTTFTASLTGNNLINPTFCIYNAANVQVACNATGVFDNLPYGSYCIRVTDGCVGTQFSRCITQARPIPNIGANVTVTNRGCTTFDADVTGENNTTNIQYCIYDNNGNLITCNTTGTFNGLPYGTYCVRIQNDPACYDTILVRCITVSPSRPSVGANVTITNKNCVSFTASISSPTNLTNPEYFLYNSANTQVGYNHTGVFTNLAYGSYCIRTRNDQNCYDTTIERCFTVVQPIPSVNASVNITNRKCNGFTVSLTSQNLTTPQFCLINSLGDTVGCNGTGVYNNVPYGAYCMRVKNSCYDTTITRCFNVQPTAMNLQVTSAASCTIGATDLTASWTSTVSPFTINIYNPGNALVYTASTTSSTRSITGLPGLPAGMTYKIVIRDNCNAKDSVYVTPVASWFNKSINPNAKCPGSIWPNGSGDLLVSTQYSQGTVTPKIIKKNGTVINLSYNTVSGTNFTFTDMEPATYIVEYTLQGCSLKQYDTFDLRPYSFPDLQQSAVYQCNDNSFTVSAAVNGGLGPFSYEIIGSIPDSPAIVAPPQSSAVFSINNNNSYGLVRLRAIDVCGNATTNDASVLPLANTTISATDNCFYNNITLSVDNIPNATYTWYLKTSPTDSALVGNDQNHNIPYLLPSDTGTYVCKVTVNSGCLTRISTFHIDGSCGGGLLPGNELTFTGKLNDAAVLLQWATGNNYVAESFVVERSLDGVAWSAIGMVQAAPANGWQSQYIFTDQQPGSGRNYYRLQVKKPGGARAWSKTVSVNRAGATGWLVFPNPVTDHFKINFDRAAAGQYGVVLMSSDGRQVFSEQYTIRSGEVKKLARPARVKPGTYYLVVTHLASGERKVQPLVFR